MNNCITEKSRYKQFAKDPTMVRSPGGASHKMDHRKGRKRKQDSFKFAKNAERKVEGEREYDRQATNSAEGSRISEEYKRTRISPASLVREKLNEKSAGPWGRSK